MTNITRKLSGSSLARTNILKYGTFISLVALLLVVATVVLPKTSPKASAATLPAYRYTETFDASNGYAGANDVITDSAGNVYVVGFYSGTVTFSPGVTYTASSNGDAFLTKFSSDGTNEWTKTFDVSASGASAYADGVAVDSSGNIYVAGGWEGTVDFGPGNTFSTGIYSDSYLAKYSPDGTFQWTKTFDTQTNSASANAFNVSVSNGGDVYITGQFTGTVVFGPGDTQSTTNTSGDLFVSEYQTNGTYNWTKTFDASASGSYVYGNSLAVDSNNNVYLIGEFCGSITFSSGDTYDGYACSSFLTKFESSGTYDWTKVLDTSAGGSQAIGNEIAVDSSSGVVYVAGGFVGNVGFNTGVTLDGDSGDAFLTAYSLNGDYQWTNVIPENNGDYGALVSGVAVDSDHDIYVSGFWNGTVTFGPGTTLTTASSQDSYVTKYSSDGTYNWTQVFGADSSSGTQFSGGTEVTADDLGNIYLAGDFAGSVTFDGPSGSDTKTSINSDAFLTSFSAFVPPPAPIVTASNNTNVSAPDTGYGTPININNGLVTASTVVTVLFLSTGIFIINKPTKKYKI